MPALPHDIGGRLDPYRPNAPRQCRAARSYDLTPSTSKDLYSETRDLIAKSTTVFNWGREQLSNTASYLIVVDHHATRERRLAPAPRLLERFEGFVEQVEADTAYITLSNDRGDRLCGPYPAGELAELGIGERDRFILKTIDLGRDVRIEIEPVPRRPISAELQREIREETEQLFADFDPSDDY